MQLFCERISLSAEIVCVLNLLCVYVCVFTVHCFFYLKMSFDDLAKYGGLYGSEGALKNIEVSMYVCMYVCMYHMCRNFRGVKFCEFCEFCGMHLIHENSTKINHVKLTAS